MPPTRRYEIGVGLLMVVAVAVLVYMALQIGAIRGLRPTVRVSTQLADAAGLTTGAVVSIAGVSVGRVESLGVEFDHARVNLALDREAGVRRDARVAVRARSVLGEKYLEITPVSTSAALAETGDVLEAAGRQVEIDEMVSKMGPLLDAVDPVALHTALGTLTAAANADPERAKRMYADAEMGLHNFALASAHLVPLAEEARATLASVRRTSEAARPVLDRLDATAQRLDTLVASVPPEQVDALLEELRGAVADGRAVLVKLDGASGGLGTLIDKANQFTQEDFLRITQEEGVLIRIKKRDAEEVLRLEAAGE